MKKIYFSLAILSILYFLALTVDLIWFDFNSPVSLLWNIYLLLVVSILGILTSIISVKGKLRISMISILVLLSLFHFFMYFVAVYGFREP